jgi:DNA-binding transcriptional regulator PaaX
VFSYLVRRLGFGLLAYETDMQPNALQIELTQITEDAANALLLLMRF